MDFRDLKDKVRAPVDNARQIVIQQSLSEKFIQAFYETASANPTSQQVTWTVVVNKLVIDGFKYCVVQTSVTSPIKTLSTHLLKSQTERRGRTMHRLHAITG